MTSSCACVRAVACVRRVMSARRAGRGALKSWVDSVSGGKLSGLGASFGVIAFILSGNGGKLYTQVCTQAGAHSRQHACIMADSVCKSINTCRLFAEKSTMY